MKECGGEPPHLFDLGRTVQSHRLDAVGATVRVNISIMSTHARSLWPPSNPEGRRLRWLSQATTSATNHERVHLRSWMTYRISVLSFSTFEGR